MILLMLPFFLQGAAMFFDEFYFHRKRGLPLWERIGHPLDSLSVFVSYLFLVLQPPTPTNLYIYIGLCAFSCLLITKDEFIHTEKCEASENWLHAVLFILHPLTFLSAAVLWKENSGGAFLIAQPIVIAIFTLYQIIYWSIAHGDLMPKINNDVYETYGERWYEADDDPVALLRAESKTKTPWIIEKIKQRGFLNESTKVLDVGCGAGFLSNQLAREKLNVTGVDLSSESLKVAANHDETKTVHYHTADAYELPFADESFDIVTAMDFLEHVERPADVIKEFSRVLKPNGLFIFHTFNRNFLAYLVIIKFVEWFVKNTPKDMHVLPLFIKPKELQEYCRIAGLVSTEMIGIKPVFSTIPLKSLFSGVVPKTLRFELTSRLNLSYMGYAIKGSARPLPR